ncbi:MAG: hypothetical protein KDJ88_13170 [Bauldia sp.]|nr:hypothetical protein [Bauldia sp.]
MAPRLWSLGIGLISTFVGLGGAIGAASGGERSCDLFVKDGHVCVSRPGEADACTRLARGTIGTDRCLYKSISDLEACDYAWIGPNVRLALSPLRLRMTGIYYPNYPPGVLYGPLAIAASCGQWKIIIRAPDH